MSLMVAAAVFHVQNLSNFLPDTRYLLSVLVHIKKMNFVMYNTEDGFTLSNDRGKVCNVLLYDIVRTPLSTANWSHMATALEL